MCSRFVYIWFRYLVTDHRVIRQPELKDSAFVFAAPQRGRMVITASSIDSVKLGVLPGMVVADARAVMPDLKVLEDKPGRDVRLLKALAEWCLRYTPIVAVGTEGGLILDITGCSHLWGSEKAYLKDITARLRGSGYDVRVAAADTIGAAWANCRFGRINAIVEPGGQARVLAGLPPAALRLDDVTMDRMNKLGLHQIGSFIDMPRSVLRRRFGSQLLLRIDQALGVVGEQIESIHPIEPYQERLPCLEPIRTRTGIEIALHKLLEVLCARLAKESKGIRKAVLKCFRMDGQLQQIDIGTSSASCNQQHLFRLFELKISSMRPDLGFELFVMEGSVVEDIDPVQETLWNISGSNDRVEIAELLDRLAMRGGMDIIHRYLPAEHYWPERSIKATASLQDKPQFKWRTDRPRPVSLLTKPELIQVTAPIPDYPPMVFRYQGIVHKIQKADGPERIEQEWWIEQGLHRDYYSVEDQSGARYWIFRLGHYGDHNPEWFIHGFFS